eukprot:Selendium_serpulae@DN3099_c0_g1_i1.p1
MSPNVTKVSLIANATSSPFALSALSRLGLGQGEVPGPRGAAQRLPVGLRRKLDRVVLCSPSARWPMGAISRHLATETPNTGIEKNRAKETNRKTETTSEWPAMLPLPLRVMGLHSAVHRIRRLAKEAVRRPSRRGAHQEQGGNPSTLGFSEFTPTTHARR